MYHMQETYERTVIIILFICHDHFDKLHTPCFNEPTQVFLHLILVVPYTMYTDMHIKLKYGVHTRRIIRN